MRFFSARRTRNSRRAVFPLEVSTPSLSLSARRWEPAAMRWASKGSMREMSPERASPRVSSGCRGDLMTPGLGWLACTSSGARRLGPLPPERPSLRTSSRSSGSFSSFLRRSSTSFQPLSCQMPWLRSYPLGSMRPSRSSKALTAASRLLMTGSHSCLNSSIICLALSLRACSLACFLRSCSSIFSCSSGLSCWSCFCCGEVSDDSMDSCRPGSCWLPCCPSPSCPSPSPCCDGALPPCGCSSSPGSSPGSPVS
mmetsp:Transcript_20588/g.61993  ORF Transcript_20588/g.61993 Transcript_20588/m.61993 type:complete len:254 (+) Transcript_20588:1725-2486(+)